jgi:hypothetical protein
MKPTRWTLGILAGLLALAGTAAPAAAKGLVHRLNDRGICYLEYDGAVLFDHESNIFFGSHHANFRRPDGSGYDKAGNRITRDGSVFTNQTDWGTIVTVVRQKGDDLYLDVTVANASASDTLTEVELQFSHIKYPWMTNARFIHFNSSAFWAVDKPEKFASFQMAEGGMPMLFFDFEKCCLLFGPDDPTTDDVLPKTLGVEHFGYFGAMLAEVAPGKTKRRTFIFRFAPAGTDRIALARPHAERYEASRPMLQQWPDRRPIIQDTTFANGIEFLASNLRRYNTAADLRTEEGKKKFRAELMKRADDIIRVMQKANAQGVVLWSVEGIEQRNVMYLGDPRRVALWPEMEYKDESGVATVDAYLKKITDAGFRVGHCLRPQELRSLPATLGTVFKAKAPGTITHLRVYSSEVESKKPHKAQLWRYKDGVVVAGPFDWVFGGENGWQTLDIPDVAIEPNVEYTVAVSTSDEGVYAYTMTQVEDDIKKFSLDAPVEYTSVVQELSAPANRGEGFSGRVRGYIVPPQSGDYTFWVAGDDMAEFHLSTDAKPENLKRIAYIHEWANPQHWDKRPATQKSSPVKLAAGQRYYFEARYVQICNRDHVEVGWSKPGEPTDKPSQIVPGSALIPWRGEAPSGATYEAWTTWKSRDGNLAWHGQGYIAEGIGKQPCKALAREHTSMRDVVFVSDGKKETIFGDKPHVGHWKTLEHYDAADPAQHMIDMISYAKRRWGSTLYYVDSSVFLNRPPVCPLKQVQASNHKDASCPCHMLDAYTDVIRGEVWQQVCRAHPDVLLMPENQDSNSYPYSAPFDEGGHHWVRRTPSHVRVQWPGAFTAINISTDPHRVNEEYIAGYVDAVRGGDLLLFQQWDYLAGAVSEIYKRAGRFPQARITSPTLDSEFRPGDSITIAADASNADGRIEKVEFYQSTIEKGRVKLGEASASPYRFTWTGVPAGRYVLSIKATDDTGKECWPASVVVYVR